MKGGEENRDDEAWRRVRAGDPKAKAQVLAAHLPWVRRVAGRYRGLAWGAEDLVQAGALGLLEAMATYDPSRGVPFRAYALPVVLRELREEVRRASGLGAARRLQRDRRRLRVTQEALRRALGREPTLPELAAAMGTSPTALAEALAAWEPPRPWREDQVEVAAGGPEEAVVERVALWSALSRLAPLDQRLLALRYLAGQSQAEVGRALGLSQSQVSRRERACLRELWGTLGPYPPAHTLARERQPDGRRRG